QFLGMNTSDINQRGRRSSGGVGKKLKAPIGWLIWSEEEASIYFNALPGGIYSRQVTIFQYHGRNSYYWSSTNRSDFIPLKEAYARSLIYDYDGVVRESIPWQQGLSVRCVKNYLLL
ncbi:MAG: hypothetical protein HOK84_03970, partial [Bacteroidetes bacterium]|nr:hypothetical protein [Bacteroidota bacterium]